MTIDPSKIHPLFDSLQEPNFDFEKYQWDYEDDPLVVSEIRDKIDSAKYLDEEEIANINKKTDTLAEKNKQLLTKFNNLKEERKQIQDKIDKYAKDMYLYEKELEDTLLEAELESIVLYGRREKKSRMTPEKEQAVNEWQKIFSNIKF